jgi:hypothetical protein
MTDVRTRFGAHFTIDRDYAGAIGEDVQFRMWARGAEEDDVHEILTPDEADALADALKHHAAEVRQINKELA